MTAMQLQATVNSQIVPLWTSNEFSATLACPSITCIVTHRRTCKDIDTTSFFVILMAEQVVLIRYDAKNRNLLQAINNLWA